jgi:phage/plasmid-associated DNA primase
LLQAWLKYAILPRPKDQKAEIEKSLDLFGSKGTGKGTSLEVLIQLVGAENVGPASPDTFKTAVGLGQLLDKDLAVDTDCSGFLENIGAYNKVVSNKPVEVKKLYKLAASILLNRSLSAKMRSCLAAHLRLLQGRSIYSSAV